MSEAFASVFRRRATAARMRFERALADARGEQDRQLRAALDGNRDTAFGREHGFDKLSTAADYRRAVPMRAFDELQPWVTRQLEGEARVLSASSPVLYFSTTGTTGTPKRVPVTSEFLRRWTENLLVYWSHVVERFPSVLERDDTLLMLHLAPRPFARFAAGNVPIHVSTEMPVVAKGAFPFSRAPWFPPPSQLSDADRLYYLLRASITSPLVGIVCLHSSRLQATLSTLRESAERMIAEVRDGTMMGARWSEPDAARARALEALRVEGRFTPRHIWPSLEFVSSWIGASFDLYRPEIERGFTPRILPQMTVSSEVGHMTMPLGADVSDGPLTVHTNYYEFRPEGEDEATLGFDELEVGRVYEIVVTTCAGLYRYRCGDQFRVSGHVQGVPTLDFVGRAGVSDLAGEKVTEQHVSAALRDAVTHSGLELVNATLCARFGTPSGYVAVVEPARGWTDEEYARFAQAAEQALRKQAPRYDLKRGFGDLGPLELRVCARGSFDRYRQRRVQAGLPGTQLKDKILHFHYEGEALSALEQASKEAGA
jgi:hypothetical protein